MSDRDWRIRRELRADLQWALTELVGFLKDASFYEEAARVEKMLLEIKPTHKHCISCGPQPLENFYVQRNTKYGDYLQSNCKSCGKLKRREERKRLIDKVNVIEEKPTEANRNGSS